MFYTCGKILYILLFFFLFLPYQRILTNLQYQPIRSYLVLRKGCVMFLGVAALTVSPLLGNGHSAGFCLALISSAAVNNFIGVSFLTSGSISVG